MGDGWKAKSRSLGWGERHREGLPILFGDEATVVIGTG